MEVASPLQTPLQTVMADIEVLWGKIRRKYGLASNNREVYSWPFGHAVFFMDYDFFVDGTKPVVQVSMNLLKLNLCSQII
jgi:hypothetical protein